MRITKILIKHFRSIRKIELDLSAASVLAGPNSCGKSNVLRAIRFAFLDDYSPDRVATNFPVFVTGPAAEISVCLEFDQPSTSVAGVLAIPAGAKFRYEVAVRRNGKPRYSVNGVAITPVQRSQLLAEFLIVYVPPIRDIAFGGLDPLKAPLAKALRNARRGQSVSALNGVVRSALVAKGNEVLRKAGTDFGSIERVGRICADASAVDIAVAIDQLALQVQLPGNELVSLSALGTGHQSQVVMNLFGGVGAAFQGSVIYMFEEPDNHLHPTALVAVAGRMRSIVESNRAQILVSSHSPAFIGSFPITDVIVLEGIDGVTALRKRGPISQRRVHALLARFGLKPVEAILARSVILVEGATDVALVRAFAREVLGETPDQCDVLVVPCGGKKQLVELYPELMKLGVPCSVILDGDAALSGSPPYLAAPLAATAVASVSAAIAMLQGVIVATGKLHASLASVQDEIANGPPSLSFTGSPVDKIARASGRVNAAQLSQLPAAFKKKKRRVWKDLLGPAGIWVWRSDPEGQLVAIPGSTATINSIVGNPLPATAGVVAVRGWLKNRASEPEVHETVLAALLRSMPQKRGELWEFVSFLKDVFSD